MRTLLTCSVNTSRYSFNVTGLWQSIGVRLSYDDEQPDVEGGTAVAAPLGRGGTRGTEGTVRGIVGGEIGVLDDNRLFDCWVQFDIEPGGDNNGARENIDCCWCCAGSSLLWADIRDDCEAPIGSL